MLLQSDVLCSAVDLPSLSCLLNLLAGASPPADPRRKVLHIRVTQRNRLLGGRLIRHALRAAAIRDDQGVLVFGQELLDLRGVGFEIDRVGMWPDL